MCPVSDLLSILVFNADTSVSTRDFTAFACTNLLSPVVIADDAEIESVILVDIWVCESFLTITLKVISPVPEEIVVVPVTSPDKINLPWLCVSRLLILVSCPSTIFANSEVVLVKV